LQQSGQLSATAKKKMLAMIDGDDRPHVVSEYSLLQHLRPEVLPVLESQRL
jgi:hypothetical protein